VLDADTYVLTTPGVTCMRGLRHDEARGCTRDVSAGETELRVKQIDDMGSGFRLVRAIHLLDGHVVHLWNVADEAAGPAPRPHDPGTVESPAPPSPGPAPESAIAGGPVGSPPSGAPDEEERRGMAVRLEPRREQPVFDLAVPPGPHVLQVLFRYQGHGTGVFAYLKGYKFDVRSSHSLVLAPGALTVVTVMGHEKGGVTIPLEERPAVRWIESR
jgi:hypothetical protein